MNNEKAWDYAIGLVQVEGIEPSDDFLDLVEKEKQGVLTNDDIRDVLYGFEIQSFTMIFATTPQQPCSWELENIVYGSKTQSFTMIFATATHQPCSCEFENIAN